MCKAIVINSMAISFLAVQGGSEKGCMMHGILLCRQLPPGLTMMRLKLVHQIHHKLYNIICAVVCNNYLARYDLFSVDPTLVLLKSYLDVLKWAKF